MGEGREYGFGILEKESPGNSQGHHRAPLCDIAVIFVCSALGAFSWIYSVDGRQRGADVTTDFN